MRQVKAILFIFLIAKSTFGMGLMSTLQVFTGSSCCTETSKEIIVSTDTTCDLPENYSDQEPKQKGCCDDGVCDCLCCGHIFATKIASKTSMSYSDTPIKHEHIYRENYLYNSVNHVWQPPQNV